MRRQLLGNPLLHLAFTMWMQARGYRRSIVLYALMAIAAIGVHLCGPLIVGMLMNVVQEESGEALISGVVRPLILLLAVGLGFWLLHGPSRIIENRTAFFVRANYLSMLFDNVTHLPMRWQRDHHSGETIDQVQKATEALSEFSRSSFEVLHMLARFFGALAILAVFMPMAAAAMVVVAIIVVTAIVLFDRILIAQYAELNRRFNAVAAIVQDFLTNVGTVISLRLEESAAREVRERTLAILPISRANWRLNELKWFTTSTLISAAQLCVLFGYVLITVRSGKAIQVGTFYALYEYLRAIGESFQMFTWQYGELVVKSSRLLAAEHIREAYEALVTPESAASLQPGWRSVAVNNLRFSHTLSEGGRLHLDGVDITLARGKMIAFVGKSGSGKSTALSLLRAIHRPDWVEVFCDGQELRHKLAHVAHHCTLIPQEPEIFAGSVRFNVTLGVAADDDAIMSAIRLAHFDSVLGLLPRGLDTDVAEKGVTLSGGEKQRLALARGFFFAEESSSEILLMDEPTSSVDQLNERLIYTAVKSHFNDCCIVSSLHKLSLLAVFDEVVVFKEGRVVERGTLQELLAADGELSRMWDAPPSYLSPCVEAAAM